MGEYDKGMSVVYIVGVFGNQFVVYVVHLHQ